MVLAAVGLYTYAWFSDTDETPVEITTAYVGIDNSLEEVDIDNWTSGSVFTKDYELTNNSTVDIVYMTYLQVTITDGTAVEPASTLAERVSNFVNGFRVNNVTIFSGNDVPAGQTSYNLTGTITGWTVWNFSTTPADMVKDGSLVMYYGGDGAQDLAISGSFVVKAYQSDYPYDQKTVPMTSGSATIDAASLTGTNLVVTGDVVGAQGAGTSVPVSVDFDAASLAGINAGTVVTVSNTSVNNIVVGDGTAVIAAIDVGITGSNPQLSGTATVSITVDGKVTNPVVYYYNDGASTEMILKDVTYDAASNTTKVSFMTDHFSVYYLANPVSDATVWDGSIAALPVDDDKKTVTIDTAAELAGLANSVNNGITFQGYSILLSTDVDLAGIDWTPIGSVSHPFMGSFDGQGHAISDINVSGDDHTGLFGYIYGEVSHLDLVDVTVAGGQYVGALAGESGYYSKVTDVDVSGFTITGNHFVGGVIGYFQGSITGCDVAGTSDSHSAITVVPNAVADGYDNGDKVGGVIGYLQNNAGGLGFGYTVDGNTVSHVDIKAYRDVGGVAGAVAQASANHPPTVSDNTVTDVDIVVDQATNSYGYMPTNAGKIVGRIVNPSFFQLDGSNVATDVTMDVWFDNTTKTLAISNAEQMQAFATFVNDGYDFEGWTVTLTADLDLKGVDWVPIGKAVNYLGGVSSDSTYFNGTFDGQGHTISNLRVDTSYSAGLFGAVYNGTVKDLTIEKANIRSVYDADLIVSDAYGTPAGVLTGLLLESTVQDVTVTGSTVSGFHFIGGIAGYVNGCTITGCSVSGSATAPSALYAVPGDSGENGDKVGGIAGIVIGGDSPAIPKVNTVEGNSVSNITITAYRDVGGLVGCVSNTSCSGQGNTVTDVAILVDQFTDGYGYRDANAGGVLGRGTSDMTGIATDVSISYVVDQSSKTAMVHNASQMLGFAAYVNNGFDFTGWTVALTTDIDLSDVEWTPIGTAINYADGISGADTKYGSPAGDFSSTYFNGTFDGQGHIISNLEVTTAYCAGLFGAVNNGTVRNLIVQGADVSSVYDATLITNDSYSASAGAVVGIALMTVIEDVWVMDSVVDGYHFVGGVVGYMNDTTVSGCTVSGCQVSAVSNAVGDGYDNGDKVGGVVGFVISGFYSVNDSNTISDNTVNKTSVGAYRDVGALVGCVSGAKCTISGNTVDDAQVTVDQTVGAYGYKTPNIGDVLGRNNNATVVVIDDQDMDVTMTVKVIVNTDDDLTAATTLQGDVAVTITLGGDITYTNAAMDVCADVTIDLDGHTLDCTGLDTSGSKYRPFIMNEGSSLTIVGTDPGSTVRFSNGGFIDSVAYGTQVADYSVTLNGGAYEGAADNATASAFIKVRTTMGAVTIDLTDVTYVDDSASNYVVDLYSADSDMTFVMNVTGGSYTGNFGFYTLGTVAFEDVTISTRGSAFEIMGDTMVTGCDITVSPGVTVVNAPSGGISVSNGGSATVKDCTISGNMVAAYYVYSTGGTIVATDVDLSGASYTNLVAIDKAGSTVTVDGVVYTQTTAKA